MRKLFYVLSAGILLTSLTACSSSNKKEEATVQQTQEEVTAEGIYSTTLPCADCPGIESVITLNADNTFSLVNTYQGEENATKEYEGTYKTNGNAITLEGLNAAEMPTQYKLANGKLVQLDLEGKEITGENASKYAYGKVNTDLVEKYWKLTEINGAAIPEGKLTADAFMTFRTQGSRVNGNSGCNNFFGGYEVNGNELKFSQLGSTMMMCPDMEVENQMKTVFEKTNRFAIDGETLTLSHGDEVLAKFVTVYM